MNISAPFIRRPIATSLLMIAIALLGAVAWPLLPVAPLPQVDFPTINVSAQLPGASPETMASAVAQPLERQFASDPRRHPDDLDEHARRHLDRVQFDSTATSTPRHRTCRRRSMLPAANCRPTCPRRRPTARSTRPIRRSSCSACIRIPCRSPRSTTTPTTCSLSRSSQISGVAQVSIGGEQKPAVQGPGRPGQARREGNGARGHARRDRHRDDQRRQGQLDGATSAASRSRQRPALKAAL